MTSTMTLLRWLFRFVVGVYFIAALAVLTLRYAVLPRIDAWRPQIEAVASRMLDAPVRIGHIAADWKGLHPRLSFERLHIDDAQGQPALAVPQARATLAWRSVLLLEPHLLSLEVSGLDVALRRDAQGGLWLAGRGLLADEGGGSGGSGEGGNDGSGLRWLLAQGELVVRDATLRWTDEQRGASEDLVLSDASLRLRNTALGSRFSFSAQPPAGHAARLSIQADLEHSLLSLDLTDPKAWSGQLYAQIDDAAPAAWTPWLDLPTGGGRLAARIWLDVKDGEPSWAQADLAMRAVDWRHDERLAARVQADALDVRLEGSPRDLLARARSPLDVAAREDRAGITVRLVGRDVALALPGVFDAPLPTIQSLAVDVTAERSEPESEDWTVSIRQFELLNADLSAQLQGVWHSAGRTPAGTLDVQGQVSRAALNAVQHYLPSAMEADTRAWLRAGLVSGQASGIALTVRGDLGDFPFDGSSQDGTGQNEPNQNGAGQFRMAGSLRDAVIDYAPAKGDADKGWPRLEQLNGIFELERMALKLNAQDGKIRVNEQSLVTLERVVAEIPDLMHRAPMLHIDGDTSGQAQDYLAMMRNSRLGKLLDLAFNEARGEGLWRVPLHLDIPLMDAEQTQVRGEVRFAGGSLALMPDVPALTQLNGVLAFNQEGVSADGLQGHFLGGPVRVSGELSRRAKGLRFEGRVRADALVKQWPVPVLRRISGQTAYTARLVWRQPDLVDLHVESSLAGLSIDLPAPLNKSAQTVLPLKATWGPGRDGAPGRWLDVRLGNTVDLLLERAPAATGSYFRRGALGVRRAAPKPKQGLALDLALPELDAGAWEAALAAFNLSAHLSGPRGQARRPLLPDVSAVRLRSAAVRSPFMTLRDVELDAGRVSGTWQSSLRSREATGSWSWREATAKMPGRLVGHFEHLALGEAGRDDGAALGDLFDASAALDFPDVQLDVNKLSLYGHELGALALSGANAERRRIWRVDDLKIANPDAALTGTGVWRLVGAARGLELDATLNVANLGKLLGRLGQPDRVADGQGTVTGKLVWRNLPWQYRYVDLEGSMVLALEQGVLAHLNSPSARLLELLSLQSASRLARLDIDPGAMFRDGFRFNSIRSNLKITRGTVHTEGVKVDSPVAAIVLAGDTNLSSQHWNLEAVVVPKLEASGAAIAAGVVVNPLVGLGALLTQWILKEPLARAMTARYTVTGSWNEPVLAPLGETAAPPQPSRSPAVREEY